MQTQKRDSFSDALDVNSDMREGIVNKLFSQNKITSYEEFRDALFNYFDTPHGANAMIDDDDAITLFNKDEVKDRIKENTTKEEYEEAYGDGSGVIRTAIQKKEVKITKTIYYPKVEVHPYKRAGKPIKPYSRAKGRRWTTPEINFISQRQDRPPRQVASEFNSHFFNQPRTESSISTKVSRTRGKTFSSNK